MEDSLLLRRPLDDFNATSCQFRKVDFYREYYSGELVSTMIVWALSGIADFMHESTHPTSLPAMLWRGIYRTSLYLSLQSFLFQRMLATIPV